jgi:hypothetical protein
LKFFGAATDEVPAEEVLEVWPENHDVWEIWCALSTQWQLLAGAAAAIYTGLNYVAIQATLVLMGIGRREWKRIFEGLREMEHEALAVLNETRK